MKNKKLICFTASYPYGKKETYFEIELKYLSEAFDQVIIMPRYNPYHSTEKRLVPPNVYVYPPLVPQGGMRVWMGIFNLAPVSLFLKDFFVEKVYFSTYKLKKWFNLFLTFRISYSKVKREISCTPHPILYSYWAGAPLFLTKFFQDKRKIVRMHGGDFYLERNHGYLPLRKAIYKASDLLLPISEDIKKRLLSHYLIPEEKVYLSYLGINNEFQDFSLRAYVKDEPITVVSCSNLIPLKRVLLLFDALLAIPADIKIIWHHFGDGIEMRPLKKAIEKYKPENLQVELHGWVEQKEVLLFYNTTKVTWFINVSEYEGLPVSIMEALSAAIPVIATDVGGTSEIVDEQNGILLKKKFNPLELMDKILNFNAEEHSQKSIMAYKSWNEKFNAGKNFQRLVKQLEKL